MSAVWLLGRIVLVVVFGPFYVVGMAISGCVRALGELAQIALDGQP